MLGPTAIWAPAQARRLFYSCLAAVSVRCPASLLTPAHPLSIDCLGGTLCDVGNCCACGCRLRLTVHRLPHLCTRPPPDCAAVCPSTAKMTSQTLCCPAKTHPCRPFGSP